MRCKIVALKIVCHGDYGVSETQIPKSGLRSTSFNPENIEIWVLFLNHGFF